MLSKKQSCDCSTERGAPSSPKNGKRENPGAIRTIDDPRELFVWLFQKVDGEGPHIAVTELMFDIKAETFGAIRDGKPPEPYMFSNRILSEGISWKKQSDKSAARCSLGIVIFIGHISQFCLRNSEAVVPLALAVEMLFCISKVGASLAGGFSEFGALVMTPPEFVERHGVQFEMRLHRDNSELDYFDYDHVSRC